MTKLAVIVPTRSRPKNIEPILTAWDRTGAWSVARLVFAIDADDAQIDEYQRVTRGIPGLMVYVQPEWTPLVPKLNRVALDLANEFDFLAFMGDDHIPRSEMWAHTLVIAHSTSPKAILYGRDGFQDQNLPTWWSMDSRVVRKLGRMVPADVQHLFCDNAVKELGKEIDSLTYLPQVLIEHMHPMARKGKMDDQYVRVNRAQQYDRDGAAFRQWMADGLKRDASLLSDIWG